MTTAAALIIGDEILAGRAADANGPLLAAWLRERGLALGRMVVLPDDLQAIAEEVARLASAFRWVFCSGGVGPTHDDLTYAAVARGLGRGLERRAELVAILERRLPVPLAGAALRMADLPAGADLWWDGEIAYPLAVAGNVLMLPGTPALFRARLEAIAHRFAGSPPRLERLLLRAPETAFAEPLSEAARRFPAVRLGSYPRTDPGVSWRAQVTLEGRDEAALLACLAWLREALAPHLWP